VALAPKTWHSAVALHDAFTATELTEGGVAVGYMTP